MWSIADTIRVPWVMVIGAVALSACQSGPSCTAWSDQQDDLRFQGLNVTDPSLHERIGFVSRRVQPAGDRPASVVIEVANCSGQDLVLALRSRFRSASGDVEAPSGWRRVSLAPRSFASYVEHAIDTRSTEVQVEVMDANSAQPGPAQVPAKR